MCSVSMHFYLWGGFTALIIFLRDIQAPRKDNNCKSLEKLENLFMLGTWKGNLLWLTKHNVTSDGLLVTSEGEGAVLLYWDSDQDKDKTVINCHRTDNCRQDTPGISFTHFFNKLKVSKLNQHNLDVIMCPDCSSFGLSSARASGPMWLLSIWNMASAT